MGYPCHFSSALPLFQTSAVHFLLIGKCEFCHHLINVQVSTLYASSAPAGTSASIIRRATEVSVSAQLAHAFSRAHMRAIVILAIESTVMLGPL